MRLYMKINDKIHGFRVLCVHALAELEGTLYELEYKKNGAKLCYLARPDENKTFSTVCEGMQKIRRDAGNRKFNAISV